MVSARIFWPDELDWLIQQQTGPEDERDTSVNDEPTSNGGEEDESGFDDMPLEAGWEDDEEYGADSEDEEDE